MRRPHAPSRASHQRKPPQTSESAQQVAPPSESLGKLPANLPAECLEQIALKLSSTKDRLHMTLVNRHWCEALRASLVLWVSTQLTFDGSEERATQMLNFVASRAKGIRDLEVMLCSEGDWPDVGFALGTLRSCLRRLSVTGPDGDCDLQFGGGSCLYSLRALTSLDLDNCMPSLGPGISQLTGLQELLVSRMEGPSDDFEVPPQLGMLTQLTRLELVRCTEDLPRELSCLTGLRLLNLEGNDLSRAECSPTLDAVLGQLRLLEELDLGGCCLKDAPPTLSLLTNLTTLSLANAFLSHSWSRATFDSQLQCLAGLQSLVYLDLSDVEMAAVPAPVTGLRNLETLKLGMNPLRELAPGPYLESLHHLDLRGCRLATLPLHLTSAQHLSFLGLSCCHELGFDSDLAEGVIGKLKWLDTLTICGQQMSTVESARCMHTLGKLLPDLQLATHEESDDEDEEEDEDEEDTEEEEESEFEGEEWIEEGEEEFGSGGDSDAETALSEGSDDSAADGWQDHLADLPF